MNFTLRLCTTTSDPGWLDFRLALWPESSAEEHLVEMEDQLADPTHHHDLLAFDAAGNPVGLAEASLRHDYVNGTSSSPVAFLEGLYVHPLSRRHGVARLLITAVMEWGRSLGCHELASDALLENTPSHLMHEALGFEETERVVYYRMPLNP
jgi:aminoglycoside 6'-N-acetyltransferase I